MNAKRIKRRVFNHLPIGLKIIAFKHWYINHPAGYGENFRATLNESLGVFLTQKEKSDKKLISKLTNDIVRCWLLYKALPYEYFLYGFRECDEVKRSSFLTDMQKEAACARYSDVKAFLKEIKDKYAFYELLRPYFDREAYHVNVNADKGAFMQFAVKIKHLFCKTNCGSRGNGAFVSEVFNKEEASTLFEKLTLNPEEDWIVEERIVQSIDMAQWNSSCVNTIRLPSFLTNSGFKVLCPAFRTGRSGSVVDNAAKGGILAGIDITTGALTTNGVDELGHVYERHPDSGLTFKGWQVPRWKELLDTAERAHRTIPHHRYVAWDFALTDNGWVLIEGNWGQMIGQYATKEGVKDAFMLYMQNQ